MLAWPPKAIFSTAWVSSPSEAPYSAAASPAGPPPTTTTSQIAGGAPRDPMPIRAASSALLGLRITSVPSQTTTGVSDGATPMWARNASTSGSDSRSIHR